MPESTALELAIVTGTPGVDAEGEIREVPEGQSIAGAIPSSALQPFGVLVGDPTGNPAALVLGIATILGRLATGGPVALNRTAVLELLRAVTQSGGAGDVGKPVVLDSTGKFDPSVIPPVASGGEANDGENLGDTEDGARLFVQKDATTLALQFRRLYSASPFIVNIQETTDRVQIRVTPSDDEAPEDFTIWSSAKVAAELALRLSALSDDGAPELAADLDLAGFRIMSGATEVLRVDADTGFLYFFGQRAIVADTDGVQDGDGVFYDEDQEKWVVSAPPTGPGSGSNDAADIVVVPAGNISSTDAQSAFEELDADKAATGHTHKVAEQDDVNLTGASDGDLLAWLLDAGGGQPGAVPRTPVPTALSPQAFDFGRILFSDGSGALVDALLEIGLCNDVEASGWQDDDQLVWSSAANGGDGALVNRQPLNNELFFVRLLGNLLLPKGSWTTTPWNESFVSAESTGAFVLEGGSGTTDRTSARCTRPGVYLFAINLTGRTKEDVAGESTTGAQGLTLAYKGDDAADLANVTWTPIVGSNCFAATGSMRDVVDGTPEAGAETEQSGSIVIPVRFAAGERIRLDLQQRARGDARMEAAGSATSMSLTGPVRL